MATAYSPKLLHALFSRSQLSVSGGDDEGPFRNCVCWHHRRAEKKCRMAEVQPKPKDEIEFIVLHHDRITFASAPTIQCHEKTYLNNIHRGDAQTYNVVLHSMKKLPKNKNASRRRLFKFDSELVLNVFEPGWQSKERVVRVGKRTLMTMKALQYLNNYIFDEKQASPSMCSSLHMNIPKIIDCLFEYID